MRDIMNGLHLQPAFAPKAAVTDNTAQVSSSCDMQGFGAAMLALEAFDILHPPAVAVPILVTLGTKSVIDGVSVGLCGTTMGGAAATVGDEERLRPLALMTRTSTG